MEKLIKQLFQMGFISSPYAGAVSEASQSDEKLRGLIIEQARVVDETGQLRVLYPSKVDLQFDDVPVSFKE